MARSSSGLTAVRQTFELILTPPNSFVPGAMSFSGPVRDGRGHSEIHAAVNNGVTAGTIKIMQSWLSAGPFVEIASIATSLDPVAGIQKADVVVPIVRRYCFVLFVPVAPGLSVSFELGAYFLPRTSPGGFPAAVGGGGGGTADVRNADSDSDFAKALLGMLTNSRPGALDEATDEYVRQQGLKANGIQAAYVMAPRDDAYPATSRGRRFFTTHQGPGTVITGQTSFVATTPTFLLNNVGATRAAILRSIVLSQGGTVAGGDVTYVVAIDSANRFSAGGTSVVPQNGNADSAVASAVSGFRTNPTASFAGAGTRYVAEVTVPFALGTVTSFQFKDGLYIGTTGSILVYAFAATVGPSLLFNFEWEEVVSP